VVKRDFIRQDGARGIVSFLRLLVIQHLAVLDCCRDDLMRRDQWILNLYAAIVQQPPCASFCVRVGGVIG
jgi:hypothetical protein